MPNALTLPNGPGSCSSFPRKRESRADKLQRFLWAPAFAGATLIFLAAFLGAVPRDAAADTIYVSNEKDNTITVVDGKTLEPTRTIPVGDRPRGILLSKDEKSLYVCASDSDHIEELDLASNKVVRTLPSGADPEYFAQIGRAHV